MERKFVKNDQGFVCQVCQTKVEPLKNSSRDHCTHCLCSLHVDNFPGDRQNSCGGILKPVEVEYNSKKGFIIVYECQKCHAKHKNKAAPDDELETLLSVMNHTYFM